MMTLALVPPLPEEERPLDERLGLWDKKIKFFDWFIDSYAMQYHGYERLKDLQLLERELSDELNPSDPYDVSVAEHIAWLHHDASECLEKFKQEYERMRELRFA